LLVALLVALLVTLFVVALLAAPAGAQGNEGCAIPREVQKFTGTENQITPEFDITGNRFRLRWDITDLDDDPAGDSFIIRTRENGTEVGESVVVSDEGSGSEIILEGPGTFTLEIESEGFQYTVAVEDCTGDNNGGETIGGDTNGDNNKQRNQRQRRVVRNNIIINNNESSNAEGEDDEIDEITETKDEADILNDEADALDNSTPADVDEQAPVDRPRGDVVDEVPTSGPLPNTGGVPVATGTVLALVLFGAGLLSIRIVMLWRNRTGGG
jgi:hypothetical protein